MTRLAQAERAALCDTALQLGEDQPTLCGDWTVKDLVVHLLVRETSPAAVGILVPPLSRLTDLASARLAKRDFAVLVEKVRSGPPRWSPVAVPRFDTLANTLELFVHHEDVRRAQPGWAPRSLDDETEKTLWSMVRTAGKALTLSAPVGVVAENDVTGSRRTLRRGIPEVVVRGLPSEVTMYVFGRKQHAQVVLDGDDEAVAALAGTPLEL